ncbi:hypothetical protein C6Q21_06990 [Burkholderia multivorans]|nr:hypothetical protein C6Q21_06990 [Burkholderia multivorans]
MDAGFRAQVAVCVFARYLDRRVLDPGDVAVGFFEHFGLEALALAVAQVLAQQHRRPVAGLGAAGAGLDVDEAVVWVGRVREHPAEFDVGDARFELRGVLFGGDERVLVAFLACKLEQVERVAQVVIEFGERRDDAFEQLLFAAERLGVLRIVPDVRVFEFLVDFGQTRCFGVVVKDTPEARPRACAGRAGSFRSR